MRSGPAIETSEVITERLWSTNLLQNYPARRSHTQEESRRAEIRRYRTAAGLRGHVGPFARVLSRLRAADRLWRLLLARIKEARDGGSAACTRDCNSARHDRHRTHLPRAVTTRRERIRPTSAVTHIRHALPGQAPRVSP